tara:strand:+ start:11940 stop:12395 length:456 start_codon:yes stop_codon:yes gene_type:complete
LYASLAPAKETVGQSWFKRRRPVDSELKIRKSRSKVSSTYQELWITSDIRNFSKLQAEKLFLKSVMRNKMNFRKKILELFFEALESTDSELNCELTDDTVLLDSGLDSLGFAILVARLEEELEFDPFVEMEDAVYPTTFGEFVAIYENRAK